MTAAVVLWSWAVAPRASLFVELWVVPLARKVAPWLLLVAVVLLAAKGCGGKGGGGGWEKWAPSAGGPGWTKTKW